MAPAHAFVSYTIMDAKGKKSTVQINFPEAAAGSGFIDVLHSFTDTTCVLIDALIKGQVVDCGIGVKVDISGITLIKDSPDADSDVEEGGRFQFLSAVNSLTKLRLPTFDEAHLLPGTQQVDLTDVNVDAFVDRMIEGRTVVAVNVSPSDDRGEDIESIASARESFQSSRT